MMTFRYTTLFLLLATVLAPSAFALKEPNPAECPATDPMDGTACTGISTGLLKCLYPETPCDVGVQKCKCDGAVEPSSWLCFCFEDTALKEKDTVDTEALDLGDTALKEKDTVDTEALDVGDTALKEKDNADTEALDLGDTALKEKDTVDTEALDVGDTALKEKDKADTEALDVGSNESTSSGASLVSSITVVTGAVMAGALM